MKIKHALIATICICSLSVTTMAAPTAITPGAISEKAAESDPLMLRLTEIKAMDKSSLTSAEKRALRKEVKAIKDSVKSSGGVYLSVGAVIIIILLLILLL